MASVSLAPFEAPSEKTDAAKLPLVLTNQKSLTKGSFLPIQHSPYLTRMKTVDGPKSISEVNSLLRM